MPLGVANASFLKAECLCNGLPQEIKRLGQMPIWENNKAIRIAGPSENRNLGWYHSQGDLVLTSGITCPRVFLRGTKSQTSRILPGLGSCSRQFINLHAVMPSCNVDAHFSFSIVCNKHDTQL
jgi:hypothetical protein